MKQTFASVIPMFALIAVCGYASPTFADQTNLVSLLMKTLGVNKTQAQGGAGALFKSAKSNLGAEDFTKVADAVPGIQGMMKAAPKSTGIGGKLGGLSSMFGGGGKKSAGLASLADSFSKLGLDADMVPKFTNVVIDYVGTSGGDAVKNILKGALL